MQALRSVTLRKADGQIFIFRYEPGTEWQVEAALMDLAKSRDVPFSYWDAAVVSLEVMQQMTGTSTGTAHVTD